MVKTIDLLDRTGPFAVQGPPISDDMKLLFSPWGAATGIAIQGSDSPIRVQFEGGYQIDFIPVASGGVS